jgi:hypothetical protein
MTTYLLSPFNNETHSRHDIPPNSRIEVAEVA